jgi:hypothetical protein
MTIDSTSRQIMADEAVWRRLLHTEVDGSPNSVLDAPAQQCGVGASAGKGAGMISSEVEDLTLRALTPSKSMADSTQ